MTPVARQRKMRWLIAAVVAGLFVTIILVFWPIGPSPRSLPSPNGYDSIAKAGALVVELQGDYRQLPEPELRELVASNAPALELLRAGLQQECRVPVEASQKYIERHLSQLSLVKRLALALAAEGKLAEMDGHTNRAVHSYIDAIRLGHEAGRDGLLIDAMVGRACEAIGAGQLEKTVSALDAKDCRSVIQQLEIIEARRQPPEETLRIERKWSHDTYGPIRLMGAMIAARSWNPIAKAYQGHAGKVQAASTRNTQILLDFAMRAFELENGRSPSNHSELVPAYLSAWPTNNATKILRSVKTSP